MKLSNAELFYVRRWLAIAEQVRPLQGDEGKFAARLRKAFNRLVKRKTGQREDQKKEWWQEDPTTTVENQA